MAAVSDNCLSSRVTLFNTVTVSVFLFVRYSKLSLRVE